MGKVHENGTTEVDEEYSTIQELRCGVCNFYPSFLQPLIDVRAFVGFYGLLSLFSWSLYTVLVSQISNIEKAFGLTSSETGTLLTIWEVGYLICILTASYFGYKAHIPKVLGVVTLMCGVSGIVCALPHFFAYQSSNLALQTTTASEDMPGLCRNITATTMNLSKSSTPSPTEPDVPMTSKKTVALALFNIAMVIQGGSKAPCYPYSSQYIDDVDKRKTGFYMGIISGVGIFGLAIGYGLGSWVSQIYVIMKDVDMDPTDPRWIGAWWLSFLIVGVGTMIAAVPMFFFPRKLTGTIKKVHNRRESSANTPVVVRQLKDIGRTVAGVVGTPLYTSILFAGTLQALTFSVFMGFEPKYMETQFAVPSWKANIILGVASIISLSIGSPLGGYLTKRLNPTPVQCVRLILGLTIGVAALLVVAMFLGCPQSDIINPYADLRSGARTNMSDISCNCDGQEFLPICGDDGLTYYSPCHAGCRNGTFTSFSDCVWISDGTAESGMCKTGCKMVWVYAAIKFCQSLVDAVSMIPIFLVFIRSVTDRQKALALGISAAFTSALAWLPGPVIGGKLIDNTCLIWNTSATTSTEYCALYDITLLRFRIHGLMIGIRGTAIACVLFAFWKASSMSRWKNEVDDKPEKQEEEDQEMAPIA